MGKRGRTRSREGGASAPAPAASAARSLRGRRPAAPRREPTPGAGLSQANKTLAAYLGGAFLLGLVVILGISLLGGTLGPILVALFTVAFAYLLFRWAQEGLRGLQLTDQDRMVQTMAGGLLVLCVGLSVVAAVALTIAG